MKLVTFTRDIRPYKAGDQRLLPDAVADRLVAAGEARDPQTTGFRDPPTLSPHGLAAVPVPARGLLNRIRAPARRKEA